MLNHAGSTFKPWKADVLRGRTLADPTIFRIGGLETVDGDTGIWSERFTAMELLNGANSGEFWGLTRWWMTMVGRGFTPSATAVSDTHKQAKSQGGEARSYVFVEGDTPATFNQEAFALAVNAGRMFGRRVDSGHLGRSHPLGNPTDRCRPQAVACAHYTQHYSHRPLDYGESRLRPNNPH